MPKRKKIILWNVMPSEQTFRRHDCKHLTAPRTLRHNGGHAFRQKDKICQPKPLPCSAAR
ncbi:hypothetical protein NEICINOT_04513 [Neisseria cinerea ATCC 14685]|uniref:Uncharacterized protein n=1 Tax=Neisseria cinerea ATCC 14685 TaxID=546262 RepID=D0W4B6_NEICI|nr:hypothetical protein NEICINOT_04513 [Neisseria cinerea ATCC 14685]